MTYIESFSEIEPYTESVLGIEDDIDNIFAHRAEIENIFNEGIYAEIDNGYIVTMADNFYDESPKMLMYEDTFGFHIEGRGNYYSEDIWLHVVFSPDDYTNTDNGYAINPTRHDVTKLAIYEKDDILHFMLVSRMQIPPLHLTANHM